MGMGITIASAITNAVVSTTGYVEDFLCRLTGGRMITFEEMNAVDKRLYLYGYTIEVSTLEGICLLGILNVLLAICCYLIGRNVGYARGVYDCDMEWAESIEAEQDRLKKYGFGDMEANDRAAVKTYRSMKEKGSRKE